MSNEDCSHRLCLYRWVFAQGALEYLLGNKLLEWDSVFPKQLRRNENYNKVKGNRRGSIEYCPHLWKSPLQTFQPAQQSTLIVR